MSMSSISPFHYSVSWTVTTAAMLLTSHYTPKLFYPGACAYTLYNVIQFDQALLEKQNRSSIQRWMVTACLVMSAALAAAVIHAAHWTATSISHQELGLIFLKVGLILISTTFMTPHIRTIYLKGLHLSEQKEWKEIEPFLALDHSQTSTWLIDRLIRFSTLLFPSSAHHYGHHVQAETFPLLPESEREKLWKQEFEEFKTWHEISEEEEIAYLQFRCLHKLSFLSSQSQIRLVEEILQFQELVTDITPSLHPEFINFISHKRELLKSSLNTRITGFSSQITSPNFSTEALQQLQKDFSYLLAEVRLYLPKEAAALIRFRHDVIEPFLLEHERVVSASRVGQSPFDESDSPAHFFLLSSPTIGYPKLVQALRPEGETEATKLGHLYQLLDDHGIGTMQLFIDKVMEGNRTPFLQEKATIHGDSYDYAIPDTVFEKLQAYLSHKASFRLRIYQVLSTNFSTPAPTEELFERIAYRVTILFITLAPFLQNPILGLYGIFLGGLSRVPFPQWAYQGQLMDYATLVNVALRHPLLPQLRLAETSELKTFVKSDLLGKLTIVGYELVMGSMLLLARRRYSGLPPLKIGALIQGFAIGHETFS